MSTVINAPKFTIEDAAGICRSLYHLEGALESLPSERDQNFKVTAGGKGFVLKIANPSDDIERLQFENDVMIHLNEMESNPVCPELVKNRNGTFIDTITDESGVSYNVRMITFLNGSPLGDVNPQTPKLFDELGRFAGRMVARLKTFPGKKEPDDFIWNLQNGPKIVKEYKTNISGPEQLALIHSFLEQWDTYVEPLIPQLETGLTHNDGNDYNIIVSHPAKEALNFGERSLVGIIDFGDMVGSFILSDLAVICAYVMLNKNHPLQDAARIVKGYHAVLPLTDIELEVLYSLICMRLVMSVSISSKQKMLNPDNEYLTISEEPIWRLLSQLAPIHPRLARNVFRNACGLEPCPSSALIRDWLHENREKMNSIVDSDLHKEKLTVFDLSIGSTLIDNPDALTDTGRFTRQVFSCLDADNARVGIGRYNEARLVYTADQFKSNGSDLAETRTIHLGIDIFMVPASPIRAPLDGTIHSVANNDQELDYGPTIILQHETDGGIPFYTLYGHLSAESLAGKQVGQVVTAGEQIATIGNYPVNGGWPPHVHFQIITDMLDLKGNFLGVGPQSERDVWLSLCPDANLMLGINPELLQDDRLPPAEIEALRDLYLGRSLSTSYKKHLKIDRGYKQYLYDNAGRKFLDSVNNVPHVGHCHPKVVAAAAKQLAVLNTNTRYLHDNLVNYARELCATMPDPLSVCYIVNSGSEANDLALRMARNFSGGTDVIAVDGAYHGHLTSLIDISAYKYDGPGGKGVPELTQKVMMPDLYQGAYRHGDLDAGEKYAAQVKIAIENIRQAGRKPAAFIVEPLLGCGGQIVLPDGYMKHAFDHVRAAGGVCIADEVQIGFGRVGTHFWGFQTQDVVPDIVTMGKPIGDGFPLAAVITTREIADSFANGMEYFNTFGGNPVSCAVGLAVLEIIAEENLQANALAVGNQIMDGLRELQKKYPVIGDVRGLGLYIGAELVLDRETREPAPLHASYIAERMREEGILISTDGPRHNVLKLKPPIIYSAANADLLLETLDTVLGEDAVQV